MSEGAVGANLRIDPDDVVEAVGAKEPRFKVLAEELSNEVGRRVLQLLFSKPLTIAQIAMALNESIQTVSYHIERMLDAGIVGVAGYEKSQRGRDMKRYELRKPAILFIIDPTSQDNKEALELLKRAALKRFYQRILCSIIVFAAVFLGGCLIIQLATQGAMPYIPAPMPRPSPTTDLYLLAVFLLGIMAGLITYYSLFQRLVSLDEGTD